MVASVMTSRARCMSSRSVSPRTLAGTSKKEEVRKGRTSRESKRTLRKVKKTIHRSFVSFLVAGDVSGRGRSPFGKDGLGLTK